MRPGFTPLFLAAAAAAVAVASCHPKEPATLPPPERVPPPVAAGPVVDSGPGGPPAAPLPPDTVVSTSDVRIGLVVGAPQLRIGGDGPLVVTNPAGVRVLDLIEGASWLVRPAGAAMTLSGPGGLDGGRQDALVITPLHPGQYVRLDGRDYRGEVSIIPGPAGLTAVNRLGLESYLAGVLSAEMGRRDPTEVQALYAQAVISRTFAVQERGEAARARVRPVRHGGRPGLRRRRRRDAPELGRGPDDAGRSRDLERQADRRLLLLDLRRPHRVRHGGVPAGGGPVPQVGVGPGRGRAGLLPVLPALPLAGGVFRRQPRGDASPHAAGTRRR